MATSDRPFFSRMGPPRQVEDSPPPSEPLASPEPANSSERPFFPRMPRSHRDEQSAAQAPISDADRLAAEYGRHSPARSRSESPADRLAAARDFLWRSQPDPITTVLPDSSRAAASSSKQPRGDSPGEDRGHSWRQPSSHHEEDPVEQGHRTPGVPGAYRLSNSSLMRRTVLGSLKNTEAKRHGSRSPDKKADACTTTSGLRASKSEAEDTFSERLRKLQHTTGDASVSARLRKLRHGYPGRQAGEDDENEAAPEAAEESPQTYRPFMRGPLSLARALATREHARFDRL